MRACLRRKGFTPHLVKPRSLERGWRAVLRYFSPKSHPLGRGAGFTLIELLMTIVVVGLIAVPLSISLVEQVQGVTQSADYTAALNLARFEMERVNNLGYASISKGSFSNYQGYAYDIERSVTYVEGTPGSAESLKQITVEVKKADSATVLVSLVTYIAKNMVYGL